MISAKKPTTSPPARRSSGWSRSRVACVPALAIAAIVYSLSLVGTVTYAFIDAGLELEHVYAFGGNESADTRISLAGRIHLSAEPLSKASLHRVECTLVLDKHPLGSFELDSLGEINSAEVPFDVSFSLFVSDPARLPRASRQLLRSRDLPEFGAHCTADYSLTLFHAIPIHMSYSSVEPLSLQSLS